MADSFLPPAVLDMIVNAAEWKAGLDEATAPLEAINGLMAETGAAAGDMASALGASASAVTASMGEVEAAIAAAAEASVLSSEALPAYSEGLMAAAGAAGDLALAQAELKASTAEAKAAVADLAAVQLTAGKDSDEYAAQLDVAAGAMLRQEDAAYQLRLATEAQAEAAAAAGGAADASAGQVAALGDAQAAAGTKAAVAGDEQEAASGKAAKGLKLWGLAAVAGIAISVKMAGDFQQSMTKLVTSAGETQGNLGLVSQGILGMSSATNTSTSQLASGMYMVESAGFHGAQGLKVLQAAAEGAQAEGADLSEVTSAVTSGLNAYGLSAAHATSFTNQMITTVGQGKMTMQDLASSISAVLPIAASYKISFAQVGGALATMTSMGMSARQGTQDLAFAIRSLGNPTSVATNEMAQFGISSTAVSAKLGKLGLTGTISYLSDAVIGKMGKAGLVLVNSMNQSKAAAADARTMLGMLPPSIQDVAKAYLDGTTSYTTWNKATKGLGLTARTMADQFAAVAGKAHSFNSLLTSGAPAAQTYSAAMAKMLGGATGLNVGLMLTGAHAATFNDNVKAIAASANGAGSDVKGWALIQSNFNFQLGAAEKSAQAVAISFGTVLLPVVSKVMRAVAEFGGFLTRNAAASKALAIIIGVLLAGALERGLAGALKTCTAGLADMTNAGRAVTGFFAAGEDGASGFSRVLGMLTGANAAAAASAEATAAATGAEAVATDAASAATDVATASFTALEAVLDALGIGLIILAISALIMGLIELYKHCKTVRDAVADVGRWFVGLWHAAGGLSGALKILGAVFLSATTGGIGVMVIGLIELYKHCTLVRDVVADVAHFLESTWDAAFSAVSRAVSEFTDGALGWLRQQLAVFTQFWAEHGAEIREVARAVWTFISAVVMVNVRAFTDYVKLDLRVLVETVKLGFGAIAALARVYWAVVSAVVRAAWVVIGPVVRAGMTLVSGTVRAGMAIVTAGWRAAWDVLRIWTVTTWRVIGDVIHAALQLVTGVIGIALDVITGHWSKAGDDLRSLTAGEFRDVVNIIKTAVSGFGNLLVSAGKALVGGLIRGVEDMGGSAVGAIESVGSSMWHGALSFFHIGSPSKLFAVIGDNIMLGLSLGVTRTSPQVLSKFQTLLKEIVVAATRGEISQAQADALGLRLGTAMKAALRQSIGQALGSSLQAELTTTGKITKGSLAVLQQIWDAEKGGLISFSTASGLAKWVKADNARLLELAKKRAAVAKEIAAAQSLASGTASAAESSYSLSSAATNASGGASSVKSIISTLKGDVAKIRRFAYDVRKLARMGLNKAYLSQLIAMGPDEGALAAELVSSGIGDIKQINAAERQITSASNALGDAAVSAMYTAGKQSGAGFLQGLKDQEKAIEAVMAHIAAVLVKRIKKDLGISSPSKVFFAHGAAIAQGLALGIASGVGQVARAVGGLSAAASLAGTRSTAGAGVLSAGGVQPIIIQQHTTVEAVVGKQTLFTANKQETYRYNIRNSGGVTGIAKPGP